MLLPPFPQIFIAESCDLMPLPLLRQQCHGGEEGEGEHVARGEAEDTVEGAAFAYLRHLAPREVVGQEAEHVQNGQPKVAF